MKEAVPSNMFSPTAVVVFSLLALPAVVGVNTTTTTATTAGAGANTASHATTTTACQSQADCLVNQTSGVLTNFVSCSPQTHTCVCRGCFVLQGAGKCTDQPCWRYSNTTHTCVDTRKSQLVAFLLSFFLSYVGAANFYIQRYDLAAPQLVLLLFGFAFVCLAALPCCILPCCGSTSAGSTADTALACGTCCYVVFITAGVILVTLASLAITAWWIADLIIFLENTRLDGRSCHLNPTITGKK